MEGGRVPNSHPISYLYLSNGSFVRVSNPLPTKYFKKVNITKVLGRSPSEEDLNNFVKRTLLEYMLNNEGKSCSLITSLPEDKQRSIEEIELLVYDSVRFTQDVLPPNHNEYVVTFDVQSHEPHILYVRNSRWEEGKNILLNFNTRDMMSSHYGFLGRFGLVEVEFCRFELKNLVKLPNSKFKDKVIKSVRFTYKAVTLHFTDVCILRQAWDSLE